MKGDKTPKTTKNQHDTSFQRGEMTSKSAGLGLLSPNKNNRGNDF